MADEVSPSQISDEVIVEVHGPDPALWGEEQLVPSPDAVAAVSVPDGVTVFGPDPALWGTEEERAAAAAPVAPAEG